MSKEITIRIPTEQYGFVEVKLDIDVSDDVVEIYNRHISLFKNNQYGLGEKEFNACIDKYLTEDSEEGLHSEEYAGMSKEQQTIIQSIKRSLKRIKSKMI